MPLLYSAVTAKVLESHHPSGMVKCFNGPYRTSSTLEPSRSITVLTTQSRRDSYGVSSYRYVVGPCKTLNSWRSTYKPVHKLKRPTSTQYRTSSWFCCYFLYVSRQNNCKTKLSVTTFVHRTRNYNMQTH